MPDKAWKAFERRVAKAHGCERSGPTGKADCDAHPMFSMEMKLEQKVPSYLTDTLAQAVRHCPAGKVPVAFVKKPRKPMTETVVLLRWQDWLDLHGSSS